MQTKINITPGPWTYDHPKIEKSAAKISGTGWEKFAKVYVKTKDLSGKWKYDPEGMANIQAIVTAVNNTYHKGINPEAVEELLQVAKALWKQNILDYEAQENLNRIIQKATL